MTRLGGVDVSRETNDKLSAFVSLVEKWNPRINLVSKQDISSLWERHVLDSCQLYCHAGQGTRWADLGSGGGFPGIVCAVLGSEFDPKREFVLVESDQRKSAFLRTAGRELDLNLKVEAQRIEQLKPIEADVVSARALSDLSSLLGFAARHMVTGGTALFLKGQRWRDEHEAAKAHWSYRYEAIKSVTNPSAAVLKIQDIVRV